MTEFERLMLLGLSILVRSQFYPGTDRDAHWNRLTEDIRRFDGDMAKLREGDDGST